MNFFFFEYAVHEMSYLLNVLFIKWSYPIKSIHILCLLWVFWFVFVCIQ